jgi:murein DD-endopeptidase MepM/ murein hydrolase activator NlpD
MPNRTSRIALALLVVSTGCIVVEDSSSKKSGDSAAGEVSRAGDTLADTLADSLTEAAARAAAIDTTRDSLAALGSVPLDTIALPDPTPAPSRVDPAHPGPPTDAELSVLRSELIVPVEGVERTALRDSFDEGRGTHRHEATDILAPRGTPVHSAAGGRVLKLFDSKAGGLMVYALDPSGRFILMYGHLDRYADGLRDGDALAQGQLIGYVGSTGDASPDVPHLHFAIAHTADPSKWWQGDAVNPYPVLRP